MLLNSTILVKTIVNIGGFRLSFCTIFYKYREPHIWSEIKHHLSTTSSLDSLPHAIFSIFLLKFKLIQVCLVKNLFQFYHHLNKFLSWLSSAFIQYSFNIPYALQKDGLTSSSVQFSLNIGKYLSTAKLKWKLLVLIKKSVLLVWNGQSIPMI